MAQHASISRRRFVQSTAAGSLALAGLGLGGSRAQGAKPNIVFILADDLGYADVSCYGQRDYTTPNIDRLALEGMRFTQAYANSSVCSATRTALITGRYQYRLPVGLEEPINAATPEEHRPAAQPPDTAVAAQEGGLRHDAGRQMAPRFPPGFQPAQERLRPFLRNTSAARPIISITAPDPARSGAEAYQLHEEEVPVERHGYMTNLLGDRAVQTIEAYARSREPFLLSLHFTAPHWPWEGPDDEAESKRHSQHLPPRRRHAEEPTARWCRASMPISGACCRRSTLQGLPDNTIVVFTSDNGGERFSKTWPFTGMKQELLEGGLRVPRDRALARPLSPRDRYRTRP